MVVFWLVFFIVIVCVFIANAQTIQRNFELFKTRLTTPPGAEEIPLMTDDTPENTVVPPPVTVTISPPAAPVMQEPANPQSSTPSAPAPESQPSAPVTPAPQPESPAPPATQQRPQEETQRPAPVQTRDRNIYFTQIDREGRILNSRITRGIPVSDSPLADTLNVLLTGPSEDELNRGIRNLIPQNTRLLSAIVRGNTAYISFSEDFMFNTYGIEGYVAQLRQIVWTVTEFSNVRDVQILIEGRRLDYLVEGIWIGSPISRQSF